MVVFGGDFRQILPVVINGGKMEIISESMKNSSYWPRIEICRLTQNMRANEDVDYANWILSLGEDKLPKRDHDLVELRDDLILRHQSLEDFVFPVMINQHNSDQFMHNIILSARFGGVRKCGLIVDEVT